MPRATLTDPARQALAQAIQARLDKAGKSPYSIAEEIGVTRSAINFWLQGRNDPSLGSLLAIETALGLAPFTISTDARKYFQKTYSST